MADVVNSETGRRFVVAVDESRGSSATSFVQSPLKDRKPETLLYSFTLGLRRECTPRWTEQVKVDAKVCIGDARDVICQVVEKLGPDLLVMGSRGYGFIKRTFLGSVSGHCARNAKCPVLIVKRQAK